MSVAWTVPAALIGLGLIVLPVLIHILVRQQSRRVAFPSLRFLQPSTLSAWRRRTVQDAAVLACRVLIIAAAVAALAAPVIVTRAREAAYATRVARAIVIEPGTDLDLVRTEADGAFVASVFSSMRTGDAVADALAWLADQPPAVREIVMVGSFRLGQVTDADVTHIPAATGLRLIAVRSPDPPREVDWPVVRRQGGSLQRLSRRLRLEDDRTVVSDSAASVQAPGLEPQAPRLKPQVVDNRQPVAIVAAAADQELADAALNAALATGLYWPADAPSRLVLAWRGADETAISGSASGGQVIRMEVPSPESAASAVVRAIEGAIPDPRPAMEPVRLTEDQLARWQRAPGPPPPSVTLRDEGDRRWFWGLALLLLAIEYVLRQRGVAARAQLDSAPEARVA